MKVKRFISLLAIILCSIMLHGCFSVRNSALVTVKDKGPRITTKYRYNLTTSYGISSKHTDSLKQMYPHIINNSGIRFVLHHEDTKLEYKYGWTPLVVLLSCMLFPELKVCRNTDSVTLKMVDDDDIIANFDMIYTHEQADGWFPTAWIPFSGQKDGGGNYICQSDGKTNDIISYWSILSGDGDDLSNKAFAYGVVAKLKELEDSGKIDAMLKKLEAAKSKVPTHRVVKFARDANSNFAYIFTLELGKTPNDSKEVVSSVIQEFGKSVKEDYIDSYPNTTEASLVVEFSDIKVDGRRIQGRATILSIMPISLTYDVNTRRGKLSVRFNTEQIEEARAWIRRNIEALARDKNIMLITGQLPPAAIYYSLGEKIEGNVMEIEFKTE